MTHFFIKKKIEKKFTLDMVPSTLDMKPSTLDKKIGSKIIRNFVTRIQIY